MDPLIVIGGGIAGVTCAKSFSIDQPNHPVILVSASSVVKTIANLKTLGRSIDMFDVIEQNANTLKSSNLQVIMNKKVIRLDSNEHRIQLDDGQWLKYGKLCICTGAKPRMINVDNQNAQQFIRYIRDKQTAKDFTKLLAGSRRIIVAGNGGIAIEIVYAVENVDIIWAIREKRIGTVFFDAGAAKFFTEFLSNHGCKKTTGKPIKRTRYGQIEINDSSNKNEFGVALGPDWSQQLNLKGVKSRKKVRIETKVEVVNVYNKIESIPDNISSKKDLNKSESWNIYVELTNGKIFGCDMIIVAIGVIPNSDVFVDDNNHTGLQLDADKGILVDREMRTNLNDIYAAGDVCSVNWPQSPHWIQMRLWTQARQMGFYAAKCIQWHLNQTNSDNPSLYFNFEVFAHVTQFFGFRVILLGLYDGQKMDTNDYKILCRVIPREAYTKVILKDGRMKGCILIGDSNLEETFEFLIYNQIDLTRFGDHLLDDHLDIEDFFD